MNTQAKVSFAVDHDEFALIQQIAARAITLGTAHGARNLKKMDVAMDLTAVHANGCALRLRALLDADEFNFVHDVFGIRRHIDRDTGQLGDCFLPRFAAPQVAS